LFHEIDDVVAFVEEFLAFLSPLLGEVGLFEEVFGEVEGVFGGSGAEEELVFEFEGSEVAEVVAVEADGGCGEDDGFGGHGAAFDEGEGGVGQEVVDLVDGDGVVEVFEVGGQGFFGADDDAAEGLEALDDLAELVGGGALPADVVGGGPGDEAEEDEGFVGFEAGVAEGLGVGLEVAWGEVGLDG
jgi:hypothetical protein